MSGLTGKGSLSIKKKEVAQSRLPAVAFRKVRGLHKCVADETIINITSLTSPSVSEAKNYSAPNPSLLASINMFELQDNVEITSSIRGRLMQNVAYVVSGASTIELLFEAEENEILEIVIDHVARTGATLVDARPLVVTGTLAAGQTDFNVGEPFKVGEHPLAQHGAVMVMVDNQPMYRNTNNQAPGAGVTGDYYEVHAGGGLGTIIRFNVPDLVNDRTVSVISIGSLVERPLASQMALVEAVQGQIDAMIPTLAALAGVDETDFQAQPNNVDLKAFGDRVLQAESLINLLKTAEVPINSQPTNWTPVYSNFTATTDYAVYTRYGKYALVEMQATLTSGVSGVVIIGGLPISIDTSTSLLGSGNRLRNTAIAEDVGVGFYNGSVEITSSTSFGVVVGNGGGRWANTVPFTWISGDRIQLQAWVPISGWLATETLAEQLGL